MKEILAAYAVLPDTKVDEISGCLKCGRIDALLKQEFSKPPRRIGQMTRFACVGAAACLKRYEGEKIEKSRIGIFLGTALGNTTESILVQKQIFTEDDQLPSPIKFSASLSNMSAFFAAAVTGIKGPNILISQNEYSFEGAILSAQLCGESDDVDYALVGGADCCFGTKQQLGQYFGFPEDTLFGEGTGWILLGRDSGRSLGEILDVKIFNRFATKKELDPSSGFATCIFELVQKHRCSGEAVRILPGVRIEQSTIQQLVESLPGAKALSYLDQTGIYPTAVASGIANIISKAHEPGLYLHLAKCCREQISAMAFRLKQQ